VRAIVVILLLASSARADATYSATARAEHLRTALSALDKLGPAGRSALELRLYDAVRVKCRAGATRPSTACMIDVARATCATDTSCLAAADIMLVNQHAETDLVDDQTRMRLVRGSDYHGAMLAQLGKTYALLAAELAVAPPPGDPAAQIDAFCAERDLTVHACEPGAKGCVPSLAYQRCAAGLVWFLAGGDR